MEASRSYAMRLAMTRIRAAVLVWCGLLICALFAQLTVWLFATFTDCRFAEPSARDTPAIVVHQAEVDEFMSPIRPPDATLATQTLNRRGVRTGWDRLLKDGVNWAGAVGTLSVIIVIPLVLMGSLFAITSRNVGVEHTVSAFIWSIIVAILVLPMPRAEHQPWQEGLFHSGTELMETVESHRKDYGGDGLTFSFFARFVVIPAGCMLGTGLIMFRFSRGVAAGLVSEAQRVDPDLDAEAHGIAESATSLFSSRGTNAIKQIASTFTGNMPSVPPITPERKRKRAI